MKKIFNIALSVLMVLPFSGCSNFLSIYPLNDIVEENFWENKDDVESVLMAAYAKLESSACITRMGIWGELRSDNVTEGNQNAPEDIRRIITKDNLLESNSYVTWAGFYDVINLANTVMEYAPKVQEKDPNYMSDQMNSHIAEARALRALAYFYLIRTFKDVPYVTKASKDDSEDFRIAATPFDGVLTAEIESLKETSAVFGSEWANKKFATDEETTGRFTRVGIYTLLADMCLWAQDYDACIEYCDRAIALKKEQYKEYKSKHSTSTEMDLYNGYPLYNASLDGSSNVGNSYSKIFGEGFSLESVFELAFVRDQSVSNSFISDFYGSSNTRSNIGYVSANVRLYNDHGKSTGLFTNTKDTRFYETMQYIQSSSKCRVAKYVDLGISYKMEGIPTRFSYTGRNQQLSPNWIIYRFTDVLLMQAEAYVCKAKDEGNNSLIEGALVNINAVHRRATNNDVDTLTMASIKSVSDAENYVLDERRREFLFEGKRWYDMVRVCRRNGNTDYVRKNVMPKYSENVEAIRVKLSDMDALYFPIAKAELKINPQLKQNPVYKEKEDVSKSK